MTKLIWLGILVGFLLGPCYFLYIRYASGHVTEEAIVYGVDKRTWKNAWLTPVTVHLDPSMNPIAFYLDISDSVNDNSPGEHVNLYTVSLIDGNRSQWAFDWKLGYRKIDRKELRSARFFLRRRLMNSVYYPLYSNRLREFSVTRAGDYVFNVIPQHEDEIHLREMKLKVKANVAQRNDALMYGGIFLLGMSIMIGWLRLKSLDAARRR